MTISETAELFELVAAIHKNFIPNDKEKAKRLLTVWHGLLGDMPFEVAKRAMYYVLNTNPFEPKPADIRNVVLQAGALSVPTADEAWLEVLKKADFYKAVEWSHPYVEQAAKAVGIRAICASECIGVERAHFIKFYESIVLRSNQKKTFEAVGLTNIVGQISSNLALDKQ